jgi:membrane protease subunit HflK
MLVLKKSPWDDNENQNIFIRANRGRLDLNNFKKNFNGNRLGSILLVLFLLWASSGFYRVDEGEEAAVIRFGKFVRKGIPGLNYKLPSPFETVLKERVDKSRRIEIGYRSAGNRVRGEERVTFVTTESTMLTGDENIVKLTADITWHVKDLEEYLFNVMNPEECVKSVAESSIREVVGNMPISSILSNQKQEIADKIADSLQRTLDQYKTGINIEQVQLLEAEPPSQVIAAYRDVQTARADKEREINQAEAYSNDVVPKARGDAAKIAQAAEGYKQEVIARAEGDAKRFISVYGQYISSPSLTRERMYYESVSEILGGANKVIVGAESVLPYMSVMQNIGKK